MARDFIKVYKKIIKVAPVELAEVLKDKIQFWAPEVVWQNLSMYVNKYVQPDSTNKTAVAVYAALCGCTKREMRKRFISDGY